MNQAATNIDSPLALSTDQQLLAFCKASGDQLRLQILRVLSRDSFGVLELCQILGVKQSALSHHLKLLAKSSLVSTRRDGNSIFYRRAYRSANETLDKLQRELFATLDQQPISDGIQQQIAKVQQERAANSMSFFSDNASKFVQQQEQIAAYDVYATHALELIDAQLPNASNASVLEVGPGDGSFLIELASRFKQVYALDNSAPMLAMAEHHAASHRISNIEFINGDTQSELIANTKADCVVVNMVLHHIAAPQQMFFDLAKLTAPGGQLFITELCSHDQDWAKSSCGDVWLGFEPEDITNWATNAGFTSGEEVYLAQRNGFRLQIRQFRQSITTH